MAAIGAIRKHGVLLLVIIGLALLAFILGDLSNVTRVFSDKYTMAKIDGKKVDQEYSKRYEQNTALMRLLQGKSSFEDSEMYQFHEMTWNQMLQEQVLDKQLEKLGMAYSNQMVEDFKEEMIASLSTQQPNQFIAQFANALAQQVGPENAMAVLSNIEAYANNEQAKDIYNAYQAIVRFALSAEKSQQYFALAQNSVYFSDPLAKQLAKDNNMVLASLMTVNPELTAFQNLSPEVKESEMKAFYKTHKSDIFTVQNRNRDINVAVFPINPTPADLKAIEDSVRKDFAAFAQTSDIAAYNVAKGNSAAVDSTYFKQSDINLPELDSLVFKSPVGSFIEPFTYENVKWYFGKVFGAANRPDSVLVATIELPFKTASYKEAPYSKKEARLLADSLRQVFASGQTTIFAEQPNYLYGREQGDTTFWLPERGTMVDLYNNLLSTPNGGIYVYKASSGYVVFQVLDRTQLIEKRQFVLYDYDITASDATVSALRSQANQFAASVSSNEELIANAAKQGIQVVNGQAVTSMAATIGQLPNCRDIVSWSFGDDVKADAISDVFNIDRMYFAVASVAKVREVGEQKYKEVKDEIKTMLEHQNKVELVAEQLNKDLASGGMQAVAQKYSVPVTDSVMLSFAGDYYMNRGVENKAVGQIFGLQANKPTAVTGNNMAYVVNVLETRPGQATENLMLEKNYLQNAVLGRERNENTLLSYLINQTKVLDNRVRFYQK
ncbi:MAG: SurA N-terminal domain-containing protein [Bacteroidales bacterium]|nr:SurA N-terminal domain-containing protein [Bacteroidales bacterium]